MDRNQLYNDAEEAARLMLDGRQVNIWTALPCIVKSVNFTDMTIEAQPAIQATVEDEFGSTRLVNLPLLIHVPICYPSAGGFTLTLPIAEGDEVLVIFASRCIDSWWQSGGIQKAAESRMHDLSDGFAIPGPRSLPRKVPGISSTKAQLRLDDGSAYLELSPDGKIKIKTSELTVDGNLLCTGEVTAMSAGTPVTLSTHVHPGVTTGAGSTGTPIG